LLLCRLNSHHSLCTFPLFLYTHTLSLSRILSLSLSLSKILKCEKRGKKTVLFLSMRRLCARSAYRRRI
jgi:hypothetical protein